MWAFLTGGLGSIINSLASGIVGPIFTYLGKKQDVTLDGFKTAAGLDTEAYKAALEHDVAINQLKLTANSWWGPRLLYMIVGLAAAGHSSAIFLDSTFHIGCDHFGCMAIPKLPPPYDTYEQWVVASLFVVSMAEKPLNALSAAWLRK